MTIRVVPAVQSAPHSHLLEFSGAWRVSLLKDFKHNAKATLKKVRKVYPRLKISDVAGGFYVHPPQPPAPTWIGASFRPRYPVCHQR